MLAYLSRMLPDIIMRPEHHRRSPEQKLSPVSSLLMEHRTVKYDVREIEPSRWVWIIFAANANPIVSPALFLSREAAVAACINEINNGIERTRTRGP
jgi:hypothetical protein